MKRSERREAVRREKTLDWRKNEKKMKFFDDGDAEMQKNLQVIWVKDGWEEEE